METNLSFGYWVRRRRKAMDLTQAELGRRISASEAMIRKIEADERRPSRELAQLLAAALAVPAAEQEAFLRAAHDIAAVKSLLIASSPVAGPYPALLPPSNLPAPVTSLVNRVTALAEVTALLRQDNVRLLTITGPPGIGKTRLAVQASRQLLPYVRDGACFVDLSALTDPAHMLPAIALALELPPEPGLSQAKHVAQALSERFLLLVLDNFEQLVEGAAVEVAALLRACPELKVLVTSRLRLDLYGEHEYALPPMTLPPAAPDYAPAELQTYEAVQLFIDRARQHQPSFALTPDTARPVAEICLLMEGIPLALELAAARTRFIPVSELAVALHEASGRDWDTLLHIATRDLPPRQQSLFAAIAWSYSLLPPPEQDALRQLAVFPGTFDAAAASAVCLNPVGVQTAVLQALVDHNLLTLVSRDPQRWRLLEMIREFALSQQNDHESQAARARHARHFATRRKDWYGDWSEPSYLAMLDRDLENYRAAQQFSLRESDAPMAHGLATIMGSYCERCGLLSEGRDLLAHVLAIPGEVDPQVRFPVLLEAAILAWMQQDFAAAEALAAEAIALTQSRQLPAATAATLNLLGRVYLEQGRYDEADRALLQAIELSRSLSPPRPAYMEIIQRGEVALAQGRLQQAEALAREGLAGFSETALIPFCLGWTNLAEVGLARRDARAAHEALDHVLPLAHLHTRRARIFLTAVAGYLLLLEESSPTPSQLQAATQILAAVSAANKNQGDPLSPMTRAHAASRAAAAQSRLTTTAWQAAWEEGERWSLEATLNAAGEALQRCGRRAPQVE